MELKQKTGHFSRQFIMHCISEVESGLSRKEVCEKYGMSYGTLGGWLKRYGNQAFLEEGRVKLTNHQKRLIIHGIQEGRMTIEEAMLAYKIKARKTIRGWLRECNKDINIDIDSKESMMPTSNDPGSHELQHALHQANLKVLALETMIDVAEEQLKINIRKKPGAKQ
jgi:transposase-like protein